MLAGLGRAGKSWYMSTGWRSGSHTVPGRDECGDSYVRPSVISSSYVRDTPHTWKLGVTDGGTALKRHSAGGSAMCAPMPSSG